jgi:hypothetical protein
MQVTKAETSSLALMTTRHYFVGMCYIPKETTFCYIYVSSYFMFWFLLMMVCNISKQCDVATVCRLWRILQLSFIWCIWYAHVCIIKTSNVF